MLVYEGRGLGDIYFQLIRDISQNGRKITVRGHDCLEMPEPVTLVYKEPGRCFMHIPGRKWNPFLAIAEIVWILSGNGNVDWISYFGSNMKSFQDDGSNPILHGAYGVRIRKWCSGGSLYQDVDQITLAAEKLKKDSCSRQAVISLWDPIKDNLIQSKDYPCNNWVGYTLRDGILDQTVVIRSNDLVWGTPYNAVQFSHLQAYMAGVIGAKVGKLTYVINNLHYYLNLYKPTLALLIEKAFSTSAPFVNVGFGECAQSIEGFGPFNDAEFEELRINVQRDLENDYDKFDTTIVTNKYLAKLEEVLNLYITIKRYKDNMAMTAACAYSISQMQPLLRNLILDFYSDSKNKLAQSIISRIGEDNEVVKG